MAEKKENLGNVVLMLTTVGRTSRKPMVNLVQYQEIKGEYFIIAPRNSPAEWIRNVNSFPWVDVQVKGKKFRAVTEPVFEPNRIANHLESQLAGHSSIVEDLIRDHGLPRKPSRVQLEALSGRITLFVLHPEQ